MVSAKTEARTGGGGRQGTHLSSFLRQVEQTFTALKRLFPRAGVKGFPSEHLEVKNQKWDEFNQRCWAASGGGPGSLVWATDSMGGVTEERKAVVWLERGLGRTEERVQSLSAL